MNLQFVQIARVKTAVDYLYSHCVDVPVQYATIFNTSSKHGQFQEHQAVLVPAISSNGGFSVGPTLLQE